MIYYRIKPEGKYIKKEDYRFGFGVDSSLCIAVIREKKRLNLPIYKNPNRFDNRIGFAIDHTPFNNRYHEIFMFDLLEIESGKQLVIDCYHRQHWYGHYWTISARDIDTNSHRMIIWENDTCSDQDTIKRVLSNNKKYKLVKSKKPRWNLKGECIDGR